jgi:hypothetical protein
MGEGGGTDLLSQLLGEVLSDDDGIEYVPSEEEIYSESEGEGTDEDGVSGDEVEMARDERAAAASLSKITKRMREPPPFKCKCKTPCLEVIGKDWEKAQAVFAAMEGHVRREAVRNSLLPLVRDMAAGQTRIHVEYMWRGKAVCAGAFSAITTLSRSTLQSIAADVVADRTPHLNPHAHGNKGQRREVSLATHLAVRFIDNIAAEHGTATPFPHGPTEDGKQKTLLPASFTKKSVYQLYRHIFGVPLEDVTSAPPTKKAKGKGKEKEKGGSGGPALPAPPTASGKPVASRGQRRDKPAPEPSEDLAAASELDTPLAYNSFLQVWRKHCGHIDLCKPGDFYCETCLALTENPLELAAHQARTKQERAVYKQLVKEAKEGGTKVILFDFAGKKEVCFYRNLSFTLSPFSSQRRSFFHDTSNSLAAFTFKHGES